MRSQGEACHRQRGSEKAGTQEYWQPESFIHNPKESLIELQGALQLPEPPRIVEGIDIAHLQGGEMVGSKVCFIDGVPFKDGYRRFKIKHGQGNNDYLSIQEVVSRRYREAGTNNELYPDVILIDGGLGQLHAAMDVFKTMDVKPPMVISLAKKEELVYTQAKSEPIRLARNHLGLKLLQYVRAMKRTDSRSTITTFSGGRASWKRMCCRAGGRRGSAKRSRFRLCRSRKM